MLDEQVIRENVAKKFSTFYSEGILRSISACEIPEEPIYHFETHSSVTTDLADSFENNFEGFYVIENNDNTKVFVAHRLKEIKQDKESIYLFEMDDAHYFGYGELRNTLSENLNPFVWTNMTFSNHCRNGFGLRRLYLMNALSKTFFVKPLRSGDTLAKNAERLWKKLVEFGNAKEYVENNKKHYLFL